MTKLNTIAVLVVSDFHREVYATAMTGAKQQQTMAKRMAALIAARYGATSPTFEQYRDDQKALAQIAKDRKLADNQWVRKPYAAAVKAAYKALPVSLDAAAVLKRAQRDADKAAKQGQELKAGAPAGVTQDHGANASEQIDAVVTRLGLFAVLEACTRILAADDLTKAQAVHIEKMAHKAAEIIAKKAA